MQICSVQAQTYIISEAVKKPVIRMQVNQRNAYIAKIAAANAARAAAAGATGTALLRLQLTMDYIKFSSVGNQLH